MKREYEIEEALHASDLNQRRNLFDGFAVVSGFALNGTTSVNGDPALDIASGTAYADGSEVDLGASEVVTLGSSDPDNPRKAVVYVDTAGDFVSALGDPKAPRPSGKTGRMTYQPEPPSLQGVAGVPLWEAWIPAGASSITTDQVADRRESLTDARVESLTTENLGTEIQSNNILFAGEFDGSDPETRLDNALSASDTADRIILESATYDGTRTINSFGRLLTGPSVTTGGAVISGDWTVSTDAVVVRYVRLQGALTLNGIRCRFEDADNAGGSTITVQDDLCMITRLDNGNLIFEAGTSNGIVDSCTRVSVTDNGSNTVGDIS